MSVLEKAAQGEGALFILLAVLLAIGIVWAAVRERKLKKGGAAKC